jgi:hypothetical protein
LRVNPDTRQQEETPAVEGTSRELAHAVLDAGCDFEAMGDIDVVTNLARAMRRIPSVDPAAFGAFRVEGSRLRQRTDSPVKSSRFI